MAVPFLINRFFSKDRNGDLPVGLALEALIKRDQGVMKTLVACKWRLCNGFGGWFREALQALKKFGLRGEIGKVVQFKDWRKRPGQDRKSVDFDRDMNASSFDQYSRDAVDTNDCFSIGLEVGKCTLSGTITLVRLLRIQPDHSFQDIRVPENGCSMGAERRIGECVEPPIFRTGKAPPEPQQVCAVLQSDARQVPRNGASPISNVVLIPAHELPGPVTEVIVDGIAGRGMAADTPDGMIQLADPLETPSTVNVGTKEATYQTR